ncbi:hypothetical protein FRB90_007341 [Tulasnella sp. 427]|nr:hypothetical protein FRB90_007341 [Tulasnella sp. 427]
MLSSSHPPTSQLSKADKSRIARDVEQTLTVIPCLPSLTLDDIERLIMPFHAVLVKDEEKGAFWSRGINVSKEELLTRLKAGSRGRFICRAVGGDRSDTTEKIRLSRALETLVQSNPPHRSFTLDRVEPYDANQGPSTHPFNDVQLGTPDPSAPVFSPGQDELVTHPLGEDSAAERGVSGDGNAPGSSSFASISSSTAASAVAAPVTLGPEVDDDNRASGSRSGSPPKKKTRLSGSPEPSRLPGSNVSTSRETTALARSSPSPASSTEAISSVAPLNGSVEEEAVPSSQPTGPSTLPAGGPLIPTPSAPAPASVSNTTISTAQQARPPPPTFEEVMHMNPPPRSESFDSFPSEVIAEIALCRMADSIEPAHHVQTLFWFYRLGPRSRDAIAMLPHLWRIVHPTTSARFTKYILRRSRVPISVYYAPQPRPAKKWQRFPKFLKLIKTAGHRWTKVQVVIEREHLDSLMDALGEDHPLLNWLSISVTGPTVDFRSPEITEEEGGATLEGEDIGTLEGDDGAPAEAYSSARLPRPFNILLGKTEHLHHLDLQNMGLRFNPILLNNLSSLYLSDGVRVAYGEFLSWFNIGAMNLEVLHLSNLDWLDRLPAPPLETDRAFLLDRLTSLTLMEKTTETGLTNLLYYISTPVCLRLRLQSLSRRDFVGERLAAKLLPILRRTLAGQSCTHLNVSAKPTRGEFTWLALPDPDVSSSFGTGFDIAYTCPNGPGQPSDFLEFIGQVIERLDYRPTISLDINDTYSGELGPETETGEPCLTPEDFEPIMMEVMNIWGKVTRGHFDPLRGFLTMWATHGVQAAFPCLSCVHLEYLPDETPSSNFTILALDAMVNILSPLYGQIVAEEDNFEGLVTLTWAV